MLFSLVAKRGMPSFSKPQGGSRPARYPLIQSRLQRIKEIATSSVQRTLPYPMDNTIGCFAIHFSTAYFTLAQMDGALHTTFASLLVRNKKAPSSKEQKNKLN